LPTDLSFGDDKDVELAVMPGVVIMMIEDHEEFNRLLHRAVRELTSKGKLGGGKP
jgi:hypothetical protein